MTTPPPPPGGGGNQPYDPTGNNPYPSSGSGNVPTNPPSGAPSYGSAPGGGMPPQAPPPAPGSFPQQGGSDKGKTLSIVSLVTGILGLLCCGCFVFGIVAVVTGHMAKSATTDPQSLKLAKIGFILGIVGLVLGLLYWIISLATGGMNYNFQTS